MIEFAFSASPEIIRSVRRRSRISVDATWHSGRKSQRRQSAILLASKVPCEITRACQSRESGSRSRRKVATLLGERGHRVLEASGSAEGELHARNGVHPDILLMAFSGADPADSTRFNGNLRQFQGLRCKIVGSIDIKAEKNRVNPVTNRTFAAQSIGSVLNLYSVLSNSTLKVSAVDKTLDIAVGANAKQTGFQGTRGQFVEELEESGQIPNARQGCRRFIAQEN